MNFFKSTNNNLPTKEQLEKLSKDVEQYEYDNKKKDCEYMMNLMIKTLTNANKSGPARLYEHTEIDTTQLNDWANIRLKNCTGTIVNPIDELDKIGVKLTIETTLSSNSMVSYNKSKKSITIFPK